MASYIKIAALFMALICLSGSAHGIRSLKGTWIRESYVDARDDQFLAMAICLQPDTTYFCNLLQVAQADPTVAMLFNYFTVATVFTPTDRGIVNRADLIQKTLGVSLMALQQDPVAAAHFIKSHIVPGSIPEYNTYRADETMTNSLGATLTVLEGTGNGMHAPGARRQYYVKGPVNTVRAGFQDRWDLMGGQGLVQMVEDPIIPSA